MILSQTTVDRAVQNVLDELDDLGLLTHKLSSVDVYTQPIDVVGCHGFYLEKDYGLRILGFEPRSIYIPLISWARVQEKLWNLGRSSTSIRDVIRHEFAHAFAVEHPGIVRRSRKFREVFGAPYDTEGAVNEYHPDEHVSEYAATNPSEDFAETFMLYVKYKGKIARYKSRPTIYTKMKFIKSLAGKLRELNIAMCA